MKQRPAFTIVELLVVIAVIGILVAIVIVSYIGINDQARNAALQDGLKKVADQVELYGAQQRQLPASLDQISYEAPEDGGTYQYRTFDAGKEFCLSVTQDTSSFFLNSTDFGTYSSGTCADAISVVGAGEPLAVNTTINTIVPFPTVSGTPDITLYAVVDVIDTSGNYNAIAGLSVASATQRMWLDTAATGSNNLRYRIDTSTTSNASSSQGVRSPGRHIGWVLARSNLTIREFAYDKPAAHDSSSFTPGAGWSFDGLTLYNAGASTAPVMAVVYNAAHDQATRQRVMEWLMDTYDVPISW